MKQRAGLDFTQLAQASTYHGGMFRLFRFCFGGYYIPPIANRQRTWSIMVIRNKHGDFRLSTGCWMYTKGVGKLQQLWWSSQNQPISGCSELGSPCLSWWNSLGTHDLHSGHRDDGLQTIMATMVRDIHVSCHLPWLSYWLSCVCSPLNILSLYPHQFWCLLTFLLATPYPVQNIHRK